MQPASAGSPVAGTISLRNSATASTDTQGREEQLSPAGAAALSRARGRLHDANVPAHVVANEPPLDSVTQRLGVQLPQSLMLSGTGVRVPLPCLGCGPSMPSCRGANAGVMHRSADAAGPLAQPIHQSPAPMDGLV